ncbi:sodium/proton antiporter (NhaA family) [Anseongella ginsenosidimutans]|uniref:Na(+)/H(+) antiporter NhaA n=1 Tax=Anseongella ginsenosidimutans TaxID=496056 RepID=A0A4R3KVG5_9SPHI|nr:Na+/H+ antiporter NhaA [Anseongella ginsenosidimutans]QEC53214.1 Na+/H+ antiporter NhaA [Anseongella ginsenosidimutans]TCS87847.1 sodium/proton antiporter (NhaA family) [Anseongella ginsenosidimutans]
MATTTPKSVILKPFLKFLRTEQASGVILICCTVFSIIMANSGAGEGYLEFWETHIGIYAGAFSLDHSILHWINDGLMAIFFLVVGMEIKREVAQGELSSFKKALLPVIAALGGMLVPALLYVLFNSGGAYQHGWGIPMATDIAFALGVLSLLGGRAPMSLKVFLMALAVIDDLGAILVIAIFYNQGVVLPNLIIALGIFVLLLILNRLKVTSRIPYLLGGIVMWYFMHSSGIHATIAGVLLAFTIPMKSADPGYSPLVELEGNLHSFSSFFIMPLFALANTAIVISGDLGEIFGSDLNHGIMAGLVFGKVIGIVGFTYLAAKTGIAVLPSKATFGKMAGLGFLGGIGFTMSIFISVLAFTEPEFQTEAKVSILAASLISGLLGFFILKNASAGSEE